MLIGGRALLVGALIVPSTCVLEVTNARTTGKAMSDSRGDECRHA
jgi:hypothetical protein